MDDIPHGEGEPNMHFTAPAEKQEDPLGPDERLAPELQHIDMNAAEDRR